MADFRVAERFLQEAETEQADLTVKRAWEAVLDGPASLGTLVTEIVAQAGSYNRCFVTVQPGATIPQDTINAICLSLNEQREFGLRDLWWTLRGVQHGVTYLFQAEHRGDR